MTYPVLARADEALTPAEQEELLRDRLGAGVLETLDSAGTFSVTVAHDAWVDAARACRDESLLAYDLFDCLFAVDRGEEGFDVVAILYSTSRGQRILLQTRCEGGREQPVCPSIVELYAGANWMERETWDMFGIEFEGHPGLTPRILCAENFEGWPLRKDFYLATREAKPWPGVKEPAELDESGNPIVKIPGPGEAVGPSILDEVMAEQAKLANPRAALPVEREDPAEPLEPVGDTGAPEAADEVTAEEERDIATAPDSDEPAPAAATTPGPDFEPGPEADAPSDPPALDPTEAEERAAKDAQDASAAAARAELSRMQQADARAQKAEEQAAAGSDVPTDGPAIPEGTTADLREPGALDEREGDTAEADPGEDDGQEER